MTNKNLGAFGVFADEVYTSTDLNRRSGEVLNHARLRPVTISRNNEQFALLRREDAAWLVQSVSKVQESLDVLLGVEDAASGRELPPSLTWLQVFDKDDLQKLRSEVLHATARAIAGNEEWAYVDAVIHEWRESALVAQSGVLDSVLQGEPSEEMPLPSPEEVLKLVPEADVA